MALYEVTVCFIDEKESIHLIFSEQFESHKEAFDMLQTLFYGSPPLSKVEFSITRSFIE